MDRRARIILSGISVLLVISFTPIVFNQAFAGNGQLHRDPLPTDGPIGDFRCWGVQGQTSAVPFVDIEDQFGFMERAPIGFPVEFCASAEKRYDNKIFESPFGIDPGQHFTAYVFNPTPPLLPNPEIHSVFIPQFNIMLPEVIMTQPFEILVPTTKILLPSGFPPVFPPPAPSQTDLHYKCYLIDNQQVVTLPAFSLATQFGAEDLEAGDYVAFLFCNPAIKTDTAWDPPVFGELIDEHLICFLNVVEEDDLLIGIFNQFTLETLTGIQLNQKQKFCFEALKDFNPAVGGQMIPIDTASLLIAGAQTTSWLIPVVLSIAGFGLFLSSRKPENF